MTEKYLHLNSSDHIYLTEISSLRAYTKLYDHSFMTQNLFGKKFELDFGCWTWLWYALTYLHCETSF